MPMCEWNPTFHWTRMKPRKKQDKRHQLYGRDVALASMVLASCAGAKGRCSPLACCPFAHAKRRRHPPSAYHSKQIRLILISATGPTSARPHRNESEFAPREREGSPDSVGRAYRSIARSVIVSFSGESGTAAATPVLAISVSQKLSVCFQSGRFCA